MLKLNHTFPNYHLTAVVSADIHTAFTEINNATYKHQWKIFFFWPKNFTFVCPTEIMEFAKLHSAFSEREAQILGVSIDSEFAHLAWKQQQTELRELPFPMLADVKRELTQALGILDEIDGVAHRATYIVDPNDIIRFVMMTDHQVGRNPQEVLRVLDALQTEELCPCNWQKGDTTLVVA